MNKTVTFKIRGNLDIVLLKCLPISEYILSMDKSNNRIIKRFSKNYQSSDTCLLQHVLLV